MITATQFTEELDRNRQDLATFIQNFLHGGPVDSAWLDFIGWKARNPERKTVTFTPRHVELPKVKVSREIMKIFNPDAMARDILSSQPIDVTNLKDVYYALAASAYSNHPNRGTTQT